jgi:hypothetical protein
MKQTAVEWLLNEIDMQYPEINVRRKEWMIDKAKEMEKDQMNESYKQGYFVFFPSDVDFNKYYEETYGKDA